MLLYRSVRRRCTSRWLCTRAAMAARRAWSSGLLPNLASLALAAVVGALVWRALGPEPPSTSGVVGRGAATTASVRIQESESPSLDGPVRPGPDPGGPMSRPVTPPTLYLVSTTADADLLAHLTVAESPRGRFDAAIVVTADAEVERLLEGVKQLNAARARDGLPEVQVVDLRLREP